MKQILITLVALSIIGCSNTVKKQSILTANEWENLFGYTLSAISGDSLLVYDTFENEQFILLLSDIYITCPDLGYILNDSTIDYINRRRNSPIPDDILSKRFNVQMVSDTVNFNGKLVMYSEPIIINNEILLVALSSRTKHLPNKDLAFFFKKENGYLKIIEYYDSQKEMYFKAAPLPHD